MYKPARGERPLWDFPNGTLYRREVAAYLVSEQLGWRLVPPTLARDGPLGTGSVQLFVDADPEVTAFELLADGNPSMARIAAFDVVTNNADRKAGHCLAGQDGHVWAIDHGLCFHVQAKLRTVLWDLAGDRLEAAVLADLEALAAEATGGQLAASLGELLDPDEVAAMARRARALVRTGGSRPHGATGPTHGRWSEKILMMTLRPLRVRFGGKWLAGLVHLCYPRGRQGGRCASVGVPCNAAMAPVTMPLPIPRVPDRGGRRATTPDRRYDSSASFAYGQTGGAARRSRHGRRGLRRRRRRGWRHQWWQRRGPAGRHPELRRRPGAHRLQQQHLQGQRHLGGEHRHQHVPGGLPPDPRLQGRDERGPAGVGRADQRGPADDRLQDQGERGLVGRHPDHGRRFHLPVREPQRHQEGHRR